MTYTATLRAIPAPQGGDAIVVSAQATAQGLSLPVTGTGGTLVVLAGPSEVTARFTPGSQAILHSADGKVDVQLPGNAANRPLNLKHGRQQRPGHPTPHAVAGLKRGLPAFYLNADDDQGVEFHQFSAPLTVTVKYTPQQILALGLTEENLGLFWFDESQPNGGKWVPVASNVDTVHRTVTTHVDHFSAYALGDENFRPSEAFIPSLQNWQVGLFQGNATFSYPIDVPQGAGGLKPNLNLTYDSAATDGPGGTRLQTQSTWVGKGWNLQTGYIALNRVDLDKANVHYSMVLNGQSYDLSVDPNDNTRTMYHTDDESFMKIQSADNGPSVLQYGCGNISPTDRGGCNFGSGGAVPAERSKWLVWGKDGTRYEFAEDAWWGWKDDPETCSYAFTETYKWLLSKVIDTHGNEIDYLYGRTSQVKQNSCFYTSGNMDIDVWSSRVIWNGNRYRVAFHTSARGFDNYVDPSPVQYGAGPTELRQLDYVTVESNIGSVSAEDWRLMSRYSFRYETGPDQTRYLLSDNYTCSGVVVSSNCGPNPKYQKITLRGLQRVGSDNTTALPEMTFDYYLDYVGGPPYPMDGFNRLETADNGQGGVATFIYQNIGRTLGDGNFGPLFKNNQRVSDRKLNDGMHPDYVWHYSYDNPAYNTIGTNLSKYGGNGPNQWPNSASVYYADFQNPGNIANNRTYLIHKRQSEFRGHSRVVETDPNGDTTEHYFHQGDVGCYPGSPGEPVTGDGILTDPCFVQLRNEGFLKGREYRTVRHPGAVTNAALSETHHDYGLVFWDYPIELHERLSGLWRSFVTENHTSQIALEGVNSSLAKEMNYTYDVNNYGNLTQTQESDGGVLLRTTTHSYKTRNDANSYIVDRKRSDNIFDGQGKWIARTVYGYDGSFGGPEPLTIGELTLVRKYYDIPLNPPLPTLPSTTHSSDTSYTYDSFGNQLTMTTYSGPGYVTVTPDTLRMGMPEDPSAITWSPPGGGNSTPRTTTMEYDTQGFHAFPVRITEAIPSLVTLKGYDYIMGTQTSETDYNGQVTQAGYDQFGRITALAKPGDTLGVPTKAVIYYDMERPVRYLVSEQEVSGDPNAFRPTAHFYDGMGREIQSKQESIDGLQNIVDDKLYDGLGQIAQQSQSRYVNNTAGDPQFWGYQPITSTVVERFTTLTYDALGRKRTVTAPDNTVTSMSYTVATDSIGTPREQVTTIDANQHRTAHLSDMYGRLAEVQEFRGNNGGSEGPWALYGAATHYTYNSLDLLTRVDDGLGKTTTMLYDSLGRKVQMNDLTMGTWQYAYDPNGNLTQQTDPKPQTTNFTYDAMDRLTLKDYLAGPKGGGYYSLHNYDEPLSANGKGQLTSMQRWTHGIEEPDITVASTEWQYDSRERKAKATDTVQGLAGTRIFDWTYDSADRVVSTTYPSGVGGVREIVLSRYDAGWRPTKLCNAPCQAENQSYVWDAQYTALDQPGLLTLGSDIQESYSYNLPSGQPDPMQRLSQIQLYPNPHGNAPQSFSNRNYTYDAVGNVLSITNNGEQQLFGYDHRDRLTSWQIGSAVESYTYDVVGNITSRAGQPYTYDYSHPAGGGGGPYALRSYQGQSYTYDLNGNLTGGDGRVYSYNSDNQPTDISQMQTEEQYEYDADNMRVSRTVVRGSNLGTTYYIGGQYEEDSNGTRRLLYSFNGRTVAQRTLSGDGSSNSNVLVYLHGDHLGSVSYTTDANGGVVSSQEYDPWGRVRSSTGTTPTKLNYTGQRLDDSGLLYYGARYYDPRIGRFVSPDSIVPGVADAKGGSAASLGYNDHVQLTPLTVDFHESQFASAVGAENAQVLDKGFWFQLSNEDRRDAKYQWGPVNPQAMNRYAYVLDNPLRYTDPTGHFIVAALAAAALGISTAELAPIIAVVGIAAIAACLLSSGCRAFVTQLATDFVHGVITAGTFVATAIDAFLYFATNKLPGQGGLTPEQRRIYGQAVEEWKTRNGYGAADHDALSYHELMRIREAAKKGAKIDDASRAVPDVDEPAPDEHGNYDGDW